MNIKTLKTVLFVIFLILIQTAIVNAADIKKGPYLIYSGNSENMTILWQTDSRVKCTLEWGLSPTNYEHKITSIGYGFHRQHRYKISGLVPNTHYFYRVTVDGKMYTGNFHSAPSDAEQNVKFLAYGDTRTNPQYQDELARQMVATYTGEPAYQTFLLHVGDWAEFDTDKSWQHDFFPKTQPNLVRFKTELPILGCMGNHECSGKMLRRYYPYPYVSNNRFFWSFDYGPVHVIILDQYTWYKSGSIQYWWLKKDLTNSRKQWKFIVLHEPGWSAGGKHKNTKEVQEYIQPLCKQYGVDVVFCGHNHYYARAEVDGVQHVTTGSGGAPTYPPEANQPYVVFEKNIMEFCKINIEGSILSFQAVDKDGNVIDYFSITHTNKPAPQTMSSTQ